MASLPTNPRDQRLLGIGGLFVVVALLYVWFVYLPKNTELATLESRVDTLTTNNQRAKAEMAKGNVDELRAQAAQYRQNLTLMRQLVPTGNEVPALLEQVSTAARRVGLDLSEVQPEPVIIGDQFDTYRYKIAVLGSYHSLAEFLTNVGSLTRIVAPINVDIALLKNQAAVSARRRKDEAVLELNFQIQTYVARTEPVPAPPAARQAGRSARGN